MAKVILREGESVEEALRRLRRLVLREGVLEEAERHRFYEKPSVVKKRKEAQKKRKRGGASEERF